MRKNDSLYQYVYKIFPSVYDDSLSYYELITKLIRCIKEIANEVDLIYSEGLYQATKKVLEEMVSSGEISELLFSNKADFDDQTRVFYIPTDYPTLADAVQDLERRVTGLGVRYELIVEDGHTVTSGLSLENGDFSHYEIKSEREDNVIYANFDGRFIDMNNGNAPILNAIVDGNNVLDRVYSVFNGNGRIEVGGGGRNILGRPLYLNASHVYAAETVWENCADQIYASAGSGLQFGNSIVKNFTLEGNGALVASRGSAIEAQGLQMDSCYIAMEIKRAGSAINCHDARFTNIGYIVALVWRGGVLSMRKAVGTDLHGEVVRGECATISMEESSWNADATNASPALKCTGCLMNISSAEFNAFGEAGLQLWEATQAKASRVKVTNCNGHGVHLDLNSHADVYKAYLVGNQGQDLRITRGSTVSAFSVTSTNTNDTANPTLNISDTNLVGNAFNVIEANKGIIYAE